MKRHKIPLRLKLIRLKNTGFLTFTDTIINFVKPSVSYPGFPKKIIFLRNDKIGDAIVTLPVLRDLKLNYPELEIHVLASAWNCFVFDGQSYIDKLIVSNGELSGTVKKLKQEKYDAAVDLIGLKRKTARLARRISNFTAGARIFGFSWLYDFYLDTNWVSAKDNDFMSRKIEKMLAEGFGFKFEKRNTEPLFGRNSSVKKDNDILIHLGTSEIRKLNPNSEHELINLLKDRKLIITDGAETGRYRYYRNKYRENQNIEFKLYENLCGIIPDALRSKVILCYDGGQAHYLSQFTKAVVIVGTVSAAQWKPYEHADYYEIKNWHNGVKAIQSGGEKKHIVIYYPVWCSPCFNIGCQTKPCLNMIEPSQAAEVVSAQVDFSN